MKMKIYIQYILLLLFCPLISSSQTGNFFMEIHQKSYTEPFGYTYTIENKHLKVTKIRSDGKSNLVYKKKLNDRAIESIISVVKQIEYFTLDSIYCKQMIDGVLWKINISYDRKSKNVILENFHLSEIDQLFEEINKFIRKGNLHIYLTVT